MKDINAHFHQNRGKSLGAQVQEDVIFLVIGCFILYVITGIFKVIFFPFRYLLLTNEQLDEEDVQKALQKARNREVYLNESRDNPLNPMNQYDRRFLLNPEGYDKDPDNEVYMEWYKAWKAGQILDTKLYWVPDVYIKRDNKKYVNPEFLDYFELQFNLHKGLFLRTAFLNTVRKYFPEFTPTVSGVRRDLEDLRYRSQEKHLYYSIIDEIMKLGLPEDVAKKLSKMELNGVELKEMALKIKKALEHDLHPNTAFFVAKRGFRPDSDEAVLADKLFKNTLPDTIIAAYFDGKIDNQDLKTLMEESQNIIDTLSLAVAFRSDENGKYPYREILEEKMRKFAAKHRSDMIDMELGSSAWTKK